MDNELKKIIIDCMNGELGNMKELRQSFGLTLVDIGELLIEQSNDYVRYETNISKSILYIYNDKNQLVYIEDYAGKIIENIYGETGRLELKIDSENGPEYMDEVFKQTS